MEPQTTTPVSLVSQIPPTSPQNKKSFLKFFGFKTLLIISIVSIAISAMYAGSVIFEFHEANQRLEVETKRGFVDDSELVEYQTPEWAKYVRVLGGVAGIPLTLIFMSFSGNGDALGLGILLEMFGVPIVFLFWFILLCVVSRLISLCGRKQDYSADLESPKRYVFGVIIIFVLCILAVIGLTLGKFAYIAYSTSKVFDGISPLSDEPITLSSVTPDNGKEGDQITLQGSGFANKTFVVWLYDQQNNKYGFLWKGLPADDSPISFPLKQSLCPTAFNPCLQPLQLFNKGEYFIKILGAGPDILLPFRVNEDVVISNRQSINISSFNQGDGGLAGRFKDGTLTVDAVEGSWVWIWAPINNSKPVNYVEFNVVADAVNNFLLGAFIDNKQIGKVSTEFSGQKTQTFSAKIEELPAGPHILSFRLDSFNFKNRLINGSMTVSDVSIGYIAD